MSENKLGTAVITVLTSVIIARILTLTNWPFSAIDPYFSVFIGALYVLFLPRPGFYKMIHRRIDGYLRVRRFQSPKVAVLNGYVSGNQNEVACEMLFTRFGPQDWQDMLATQTFDGQRWSSDLIPLNRISKRFTVVINPFGEYFPESDLITFSGFRKIVEYIRSGGIFVNVAGVGFYWAWDVNSGRRYPTSKDMSAFAETTVDNQKLILPAFPRGRVPSITDTKLREHFGVWTTASDTAEFTDCFQTPRDRVYAGDLENVGNTRKVAEWRAVDERTAQFIPLLRTKSKLFGECYPLAAIPYGEGYLMLAGMDLQTRQLDGNVSVDHAELEKICVAIRNIVQRMRDRQWPARA